MMMNSTFVSSLQDQIILTFDTIFPFWTLFYLEIELINDLYENSTSNIEVQLVYSPIYQAGSGDLQFSELMVDPSPTVGLPDVEYIELYNHSDSILNIDSYLFLSTIDIAK